MDDLRDSLGERLEAIERRLERIGNLLATVEPPLCNTSEELSKWRKNRYTRRLCDWEKFFGIAG